MSRGPFAELNLSVRVGDDAAAVRANWRRVQAVVGGALRFVCMTQVHGDAIARVTDPAHQVGQADAMVGREAATVLCVLTADCVPLLLVAPQYHVAAVVHAGWRGTLAGIALRTLRYLVRNFGIEPTDVQAALGPAIGGCCYEVDASIADDLERRWGTMQQAVFRTPAVGAKATVDLRAINRAQLLAAGMQPQAVVEAGPCTRCAANDYFSYRGATMLGNPVTGRQLSFIGWQE